MNTKLKLAMMVSGMVLGVSGAAFAATGQLPDVVKGGVAAITGSSSGAGILGTPTTGTAATDQYGDSSGNGGAAGDQYGPGEPGDKGSGNVEADHDAAANQYGEDNGVSEVARDKEATGTMTLPNGHEVENHGMAVSGAARQHDSDELSVPPVPPVTHTQTQPAMGAPDHRPGSGDADRTGSGESHAPAHGSMGGDD